MDPFLVWQLVDSAFPTGGFAHASGLEAAVQLGAVRGRDDLLRYAAEVVWNAAGFALPFVAEAHARPERLAALDARAEAFLRTEVANRASRAQGEALLRAASAAFGGAVTELARGAREQRLAMHLAPVHGAVLSSLGVSLADARRMFLFVQLRGLTSAAVRLGVVGPLEAQALQARLAGVAALAAASTEDVALADAAQSTPLLDLYQGHQDRLYSRLFRS